MQESHSVRFHSVRSAVSLLNHTVRRGSVSRRSWPVISQLPFLRPKFTAQVLCIPLYSPLWVSPSPAVPDMHSRQPGPRKADIFTKLC